MGEPPDRLQATQATQKGINVVQQVRAIQSQYWKSIHPKGDSNRPYLDDCADNDRFSITYFGRWTVEWWGYIFCWYSYINTCTDIIREWQAMHLYDRCQLTELQILRDNVSKSFKNQVLASYEPWSSNNEKLAMTDIYRPNYDTKRNLLVFFHDPYVHLWSYSQTLT